MLSPSVVSGETPTYGVQLNISIGNIIHQQLTQIRQMVAPPSFTYSGRYLGLWAILPSITDPQ